jgi:hypothetical protein
MVGSAVPNSEPRRYLPFCVRFGAQGKDARQRIDASQPGPRSVCGRDQAVRPATDWATVDIQRLTALRPGKVCLMQTCDLDMSGKIWVYSPPMHQMLYRDQQRQIFIGPLAQKVLMPWLKTDRDAYLFSPADARAERHASMRERRKTCVQPSKVNRKRPDHGEDRLTHEHLGQKPGDDARPLAYPGMRCHRLCQGSIDHARSEPGRRLARRDPSRHLCRGPDVREGEQLNETSGCRPAPPAGERINQMNKGCQVHG